MKRWKRLILIGAVILLLSAAGIVAHWQYYEYLTNAELERIRAAGEPVTFAELSDCYRVAAEGFPGQDAWLAALAEFRRVWEIEQQSGPIPFDLDEVREYSFVGRLWPERSLAEAYLRRYDKTLSLLRKAAVHPGPVCSLVENKQTKSIESQYAKDIKQLSNLLLLKSSIHAHRGNADAVANDLILMLTLGRCLEFDPSIRGTLVRIIVDHSALDQIVKTLPAIELSDASLEELQERIRAIDYRKHYRLSLLRERIEELEFIELCFGDNAYGLSHGWSGFHLVWTPRTRPAYLMATREMIAATDGDWPQIRRTGVETHRRQGGPIRIPFVQYPYKRVEEMMARPGADRSFLRAVCRARAVDAAIAIERYRRQHSQMPQSLAELVPEFLPTTPLDPVDGQPLRYRVDPDAVCIYSIGINETDDRATAEALETLKDVGYRVPLKERP